MQTLVSEGHRLPEILEYDFRQIFYFVDVIKSLHNNRKIEELNLQIAVKNGGEALEDYASKLTSD